MKEEWTFWEVVKKKAVSILGITIVATFVFIKAVDFLLNWCFNNEPVVYGHRTNYTIVGFMPFILVIAFIITTNIIKRRLNSSGGEQQLNKQEHYTWSDIFKEKESILLYILVSVAIFASLHFSIQKISTLSNFSGKLSGTEDQKKWLKKISKSEFLQIMKTYKDAPNVINLKNGKATSIVINIHIAD